MTLKGRLILLLDGANSVPVKENDVKTQHKLYDMMQGKTVIVILHRFSTIAWMDWTIVFEKGADAEVGTYTELLKK